MHLKIIYHQQLNTNYSNFFSLITCIILQNIHNHPYQLGKVADTKAIWAHNPILRYLSKFETDQSNTSTNSDHTIIISRWSFPYALFKTRRYSTKTHRKVFDYKSMNSEQWQNFSDQVTQNLTLNHTPLSTITTESLETTWHKIQTSIINAALQHIPYKKFKVRNF